MRKTLTSKKKILGLISLLISVLIYLFGQFELAKDFFKDDPLPIETQTINDSEESYEVIKIIDGDTIKIAYQGEKKNVRLLQIDTPEISKNDNAKATPLGEMAKQFTEDFLKDKKIRLEFDVEPYDRYGRMLCYVYVDDKCLNEELLRAGLARVMKRGKNIAKYDLYKQIEEEIKAKGLGIWRDFAANFPKKEK